MVGATPVKLESSSHTCLTTQQYSRSDTTPTPSQTQTQDTQLIKTETQNISHTNTQSECNSILKQDENCITIVLTDEDVQLNEVEVETTDVEHTNLKDYVTSYTVTDDETSDLNNSFLNCNIKVERAPSDCGYESLGSPHSVNSCDYEMSELWNQSVTELFPTLM